LSLTIIR